MDNPQSQCDSVSPGGEPAKYPLPSGPFGMPRGVGARLARVFLGVNKNEHPRCVTSAETEPARGKTEHQSILLDVPHVHGALYQNHHNNRIKVRKGLRASDQELRVPRPVQASVGIQGFCSVPLGQFPKRRRSEPIRSRRSDTSWPRPALFLHSSDIFSYPHPTAAPRFPPGSPS